VYSDFFFDLSIKLLVPPNPQHRISIATLTRVARPVIAHGFGKTVARKHQQEGHHHQGYALAQGCGGRRDGLGSDRGGSATPLLRKAEGGGTASHYRTVSGEVLRWNGVKKMHSMKMKVEETHAVTGVINRVTSVRTYSQDSRSVCTCTPFAEANEDSDASEPECGDQSQIPDSQIPNSQIPDPQIPAQSRGRIRLAVRLALGVWRHQVLPKHMYI
jgi:hypothetical protein